jgi:hypothetical protein
MRRRHDVWHIRGECVLAVEKYNNTNLCYNGPTETGSSLRSIVPTPEREQTRSKGQKQ